ncbi:MAG: cytochrome b/b6 domain-containing protein [Acidimicrobiales bacterium]
MAPTPPNRTAVPTTTEAAIGGPVVRNNRATRWLHTALYLVTFVLLATGWWLRTGHEGQPTLLADVLDSPDTEVHRTAGWVLLGIAVGGPILGIRGTLTFVRETLRINKGDGAWFWRWPRGALTGRFGRHRGHFDPGQRLLNVALVGALGTVIVSGVFLTTLSGGPTFATMVRVHRGSTYVLTGLVVGHLLVTLGILPGYRGVWRAMHWRGRVAEATVRRLWPATVPVSGDRRRGDGTEGDASGTDVRSGSHVEAARGDP